MNLGTDPEFFILDDKGKPVPAHRLFPSAKEKMNLSQGFGSNLPDGMGIRAFRDGYAVELNVPAGFCRDGLIGNVMNGITSIRNVISAKGYTLTTAPAVQIDLEDFAKDAPEDVRTFGCKPSLCAYTGRVKSPPIDAMTHPYRYAGGHIHISAESGSAPWYKNEEQAAKFVRMLDLYVGIPLAILFPSPSNWARREWYGQAGEFRMQSYPTWNVRYAGIPPNVKGTWEKTPNTFAGVEYRTPSPEIYNHPAVASFALGAVRNLFAAFPEMEKTWDAGKEAAIRHAVNTGDGAEALMPEQGPPVNGYGYVAVPFYDKTVFRNVFFGGKGGPHFQYQSMQVLSSSTAPQGWLYAQRMIVRQ